MKQNVPVTQGGKKSNRKRLTEPMDLILRGIIWKVIRRATKGSRKRIYRQFTMCHFIIRQNKQHFSREMKPNINNLLK